MTDSFRSFAVIPAAGRSRRMGQPKLLLPWQGRTVLESTLDAWRAAAISRIVVVARDDDPTLAAVARSAGADVVQLHDPPEMKDSVRAALEFLAQHEQPSERDVWLLAPADMPWLSPQAIRSLLEAHDPQHPKIIAPTTGGRRGHPVLFPWSLAEQIARLAPDEGVNALLDRCGWSPLVVTTDTIHGDLDTPEDYRARTD